MGTLKLKIKQFYYSKFKQFNDSGIADIHSRVDRFVGQKAIAESSANVYSCLQFFVNVPCSK